MKWWYDDRMIGWYDDIENLPFWRSHDFLGVLGRSVSKNYPQWTQFQLCMAFGRRVTSSISVFWLTFRPKRTCSSSCVVLIWHYLTLFDIILTPRWHYLALFGIIRDATMTLFDTIWHYLTLFGTIWHYLTLFDRNRNNFMTEKGSIFLHVKMVISWYIK